MFIILLSHPLKQEIVSTWIELPTKQVRGSTRVRARTRARVQYVGRKGQFMF